MPLSRPVRPEEPFRIRRPNVFYLEVPGKHLMWGLGYDTTFNRYIGAGGSFGGAPDDALGAALYLNVYPFGGRRSAALIQCGPTVFHANSAMSGLDIPKGFNIEGYCGVGYEFRGPVLFRALFNSHLSKAGYRPWLTLAI